MNTSPKHLAETERILLTSAAASNLLLSAGVVACMIYLLLTLASLATQPAMAQPAPASARVQLEAGIEKEDVQGDLKSAMDIYQKIAADKSSPRDVRAEALLRLAGCDEKLGKQAKEVYEQIVHDFADQPVATQARNRLAALKQQEHPGLPTTMRVRKVGSSDLFFSEDSTDGEHILYLASDGNLYFSDVSGRGKHLVFHPQRKLDYWRLSPDSSTVALFFGSRAGQPTLMAMIKSDGTGYRELLHDGPEGTWLTPSQYISLDWSWDNRYLRVLRMKGTPDAPNAARLLIVSAADGQRQEFKLPGSTCVSRAVSSPDGRFLAYETWPSCDEKVVGVRRVFVEPIKGGEPRLVYESKPQAVTSDSNFNSLKDWTADGHYLVIQDLTKEKQSALFLLPMKDGRAVDAAKLDRYGEFMGAWTVANGSLVYAEYSSRLHEEDDFAASLDAAGHLGKWQHLDLPGGVFPNGEHWSTFSPDGSELSYLMPSLEAGKVSLVLRDVFTGKERVLYKLTGQAFGCEHAISAPVIFCTSTSDDSKTKLVSIAEETGAVELLGSFDRPRVLIQQNSDGKTLYFDSSTFLGPGYFLQFDLAEKKETALGAEHHGGHPYTVSPDGEWLVWSNSPELSVRRVSGGEWKSLTSDSFQSVLVSPNSKWIIYQRHSAGADWVMRVPITGGEPEQLGKMPNSFGNCYFGSSSGGHILATCSKDPSDTEAWVLENFVPSAKN